MSTLIIIAGASGEIGLEYVKQIQNTCDVVAISQNRDISNTSKNTTCLKFDLTSEVQVEHAMKSIALESYSEIIYLHTIGVDYFDPRGYPNLRAMNTIPESVYNTNVNTFKYLLKYLIKRLSDYNSNNKQNIELKIAIIAGTGDKYTPFVIESFCEAKFILRQYIQSAVSMFPKWVSGMSINISSTITNSALKVRPSADTTYWLTPVEVVQRSIRELLTIKKGYCEINIYKESPDYYDGYYRDDEALYVKWTKETQVA